jgi:hypothetical protein
MATFMHLLTFGTFFPIWYFVPRKIWQHWSKERNSWTDVVVEFRGKNSL